MKTTSVTVYKWLIGLIFSLAASTAWGVTCTSGDWSGLCDLPEWEHTRCANVENFKFFCDNSTAGCAEVGGCFGTTPSGHWYAFQIEGVVKRCRCGCFAEDTTFTGPFGKVSTAAIRSNRETELLGLSSLSSSLDATVRLSNVTVGDEHEDVFTFTTKSGSVITLTSAHPVVIADEQGEIIAVKAASEVQASDLLLDENRQPQAIASIDEHAFEGKVVNFDVASTNPAEHVVSANGLLMGDNSWQQRLASEDRRILDRAALAKEMQK